MTHPQNKLKENKYSKQGVSEPIPKTVKAQVFETNHIFPV